MTVPIMAEPIGTTRALQEVSIRARVRGFLKEIHFDEGGDVKEGQLLFVIDEEPFKAARRRPRRSWMQAEAALKKARESKAREVADGAARAGPVRCSARRGRGAARAGRSASATPPSAEDVERKQAIRKKDAAQVEADQASLEQAKADYESRSSPPRPRSPRRRPGSATPRSTWATAGCPRRSTAGSAWPRSRSATSSAPRPAGGGADTPSWRRPAARPDGRRHPGHLPLPRPGDAADRPGAGRRGLPARPRGGGGPQVPGKATVIDNTIDATTSTFLVKAEVANPEKTILPGEYVKVNARSARPGTPSSSPSRPWSRPQAGPIVYTVDEQGKVAIVPVRATFTHEGLRVLESGLNPASR